MKVQHWPFEDKLLTLTYRRKDSLRVDAPHSNQFGQSYRTQSFAAGRSSLTSRNQGTSAHLSPYQQKNTSKQATGFALIRGSVKQFAMPRATSLVPVQSYKPRKPPVWVPAHLAFNCHECQTEFSQGPLSTRKVEHCRNCGRCFCMQCSSNTISIPEFGYFEPTRVCQGCHLRLERQADE